MSRRARQRESAKPWQRQPLPDPPSWIEALAQDLAKREPQPQPKAP